MQRARAFFYVSLGILALAVSWRLFVAAPALAQAQTPIGDVNPSSTDYAYGVQGSTLYAAAVVVGQLDVATVPLPVSGTVIACYGRNQGGSITLGIVLYADGSIYDYSSGNGWRADGSLFPGGEPAIRTTWGRVKADRR